MSRQLFPCFEPLVINVPIVYGGICLGPDLLFSTKNCLKRPLHKRPKIGFHDQQSLHAGQRYCRMPQGEHSAILSTFIKLPFVIKIFVLTIFEWPLKTGFTLHFVMSF